MVGIILLAVLVNSCQVSQRNGSLKDYNANVAAVMGQSNAAGRQFFTVLTSGAAPRSVYTSVNQAHTTADNQVVRAQRFSIPDGLSEAQQNLVLALRMRRDAIAGVADHVEAALGGRAPRDAVNAIAADMARLYSSDVLYKDYVLPLIVGALNADQIPVGGLNGQQMETGQVLPDVRWMNPTFVASQLHVNGAGNAKKIAPGDHGHGLNSVSAGGTSLSSSATTMLPAGTTAFTLNFTNLGQNPETNVVCQLTLSPLSGAGRTYSGQRTVPRTTPHQTTTCDVTPSGNPPAGTYTAKATIKPVPGESDDKNNTLTYTVTLG